MPCDAPGVRLIINASVSDENWATPYCTLVLTRELMAYIRACHEKTLNFQHENGHAIAIRFVSNHMDWIDGGDINLEAVYGEDLACALENLDFVAEPVMFYTPALDHMRTSTESLVCNGQCVWWEATLRHASCVMDSYGLTVEALQEALDAALS